AEEHWWKFSLGLERLQSFLRKHHPKEYDAVWVYNHGEDATEDEFIMACIDCYRKHFNPATLAAEIHQLDAEHTQLVDQWRDLPTELAKEKAKVKLAAIEERMETLRRQQEDLADLVEQHYTELLHLEEAIAEAKKALENEAG